MANLLAIVPIAILSSMLFAFGATRVSEVAHDPTNSTKIAVAALVLVTANAAYLPLLRQGLAFGYALSSVMTLLLVFAFAVTIKREPVSPDQWFGVGLLCVGICLLTLGKEARA